MDEFVPPALQTEGVRFRKGFDTMDVWFDSGSSWTLIQELGLKSPTEPVADIYLEGSDQHRGWFQSSLLTWLCSVDANSARSPYGAVVTHGFVLDQEGKKMSKSAGNGIMPLEVIKGTKVSLHILCGIHSLVSYASGLSRSNHRLEQMLFDFGQLPWNTPKTLMLDRRPLRWLLRTLES